ncbi:MAG TPA: hypothetical protein VLA97_14400 [Nocardioidaceae bacterium]|jgi:hypothetical protein|nr:hypothetical protein [Nocardioidaceae bacterium]
MLATKPHHSRRTTTARSWSARVNRYTLWAFNPQPQLSGRRHRLTGR